jgi:hypothetical protein
METIHENCKLCGTETLETCWLFCVHQLTCSTWQFEGYIRSSCPNWQFLYSFTNGRKYNMFTHSENTWEFQSLYWQKTVSMKMVLTTRQQEWNKYTSQLIICNITFRLYLLNFSFCQCKPWWKKMQSFRYERDFPSRTSSTNRTW